MPRPRSSYSAQVPFFPVSVACLAVALLAALTQREVRDLGAGAGQAAVVSAR